MFLIISLLSLLDAYFTGNMSVWQSAIDEAQWETLSNDEKAVILNTEYGFVASFLDDAPTGAKHDAKTKAARNEKATLYLNQFISHLEDAKSFLPESRYCTYRSAAYAYDFMLTKNLSSGIKSFQLCHDAVELDPNDPIALSLVGNVEFFSPKIFGGSKKKALADFEKAKEIIMADEQYELWWNRPALLLCIVQCYEKLGDIDRAKQEAQALLELYPQFTFLKDSYLPELENKKTGR